jgi:hypothetical protein
MEMSARHGRGGEYLLEARPAGASRWPDRN